MNEYQLRFALNLLGYAAQRDVSPERLCALSGIEFEGLKQQKATLTPKQLNDLWLNASHLSNDPLLGLHFGESMQLAALGIVGQLIQNSRTVGEALTHAAEFTHLLTDFFGMEVTRRDGCFTVRFLPNEGRAEAYPFVFRQMIDLCFVLVIHEVDGLVLAKIKPNAVILPCDESDAYEYGRILRCRPTPNAGAYALEFDDRYWDEPILTAKYELQSVLLQKANTMSNTTERNQSLNGRICTFLLANTYLGIPTLNAIAANFNTSTRTLQRQLQDEGVTYQQLADSVRKSLAMHYLKSGNYPVKEISYLLGYNELSAFTRAFRRWTGTTPVNYQRG